MEGLINRPCTWIPGPKRLSDHDLRFYIAIPDGFRRDSPSNRRIYPTNCNKRRRAIHSFDSANSVGTCAAFFARPR